MKPTDQIKFTIDVTITGTRHESVEHQYFEQDPESIARMDIDFYKKGGAFRLSSFIYPGLLNEQNALSMAITSRIHKILKDEGIE